MFVTGGIIKSPITTRRYENPADLFEQRDFLFICRRNCQQYRYTGKIHRQFDASPAEALLGLLKARGELIGFSMPIVLFSIPSPIKLNKQARKPHECCPKRRHQVLFVR
jgi:hypothetical protein